VFVCNFFELNSIICSYCQRKTGFVKTGAVSIAGIEGLFEYSYNQTADNRFERTIRSMSVLAHGKMRPCGTCEFFPFFEKFSEYYGAPAFANKWIEAAFEGDVVRFKQGEWDFTHYDREARAGTLR